MLFSFCFLTVAQIYNVRGHLSLSVLRQQLVNRIRKQSSITFAIFTHALHQLRVFLRHIIQIQHQRHLLAVRQRHLKHTHTRTHEQESDTMLHCRNRTGCRSHQLSAVFEDLLPRVILAVELLQETLALLWNTATAEEPRSHTDLTTARLCKCSKSFAQDERAVTQPEKQQSRERARRKRKQTREETQKQQKSRKRSPQVTVTSSRDTLRPAARDHWQLFSRE